jgi:hypothetical protein
LKIENWSLINEGHYPAWKWSQALKPKDFFVLFRAFLWQFRGFVSRVSDFGFLSAFGFSAFGFLGCAPYRQYPPTQTHP